MILLATLLAIAPPEAESGRRFHFDVYGGAGVRDLDLNIGQRYAAAGAYGLDMMWTYGPRAGGRFDHFGAAFGLSADFTSASTPSLGALWWSHRAFVRVGGGGNRTFGYFEIGLGPMVAWLRSKDDLQTTTDMIWGAEGRSGLGFRVQVWRQLTIGASGAVLFSFPLGLGGIGVATIGFQLDRR